MIFSDQNPSLEELAKAYLPEISLMDFRLINRVLIGCTNLVHNTEQIAYDRNLKLRKISGDEVAGITIMDRVLLSSDNNLTFRPYDSKEWFPEKIGSRSINRNLKAQVKTNILKKVENPHQSRSRPGKPRMDDSRKIKLSGRPSYYSANDYVIKLKNILSRTGPRSIIYTQLRESRMIWRYAKACEYERLIRIRDNGPNDYIRALKIKGPFMEEKLHSLEIRYEVERNDILKKNKRELISKAAQRASDILRKLSWQDPIYTEFFIHGGLSY